MPDTFKTIEDLVTVNKQMVTMREYLIKVIDDTLAGHEADEWVDISVLQHLFERKQALTNAAFVEMPAPAESEFEPAKVETEEEVVEQLRVYIDAVDPDHSGIDVASLPGFRHQK